MSKNIVIFSTKGGVGKTVIAANLAVSLAIDQAKRVCLVDLDMQAIGDISRVLNVKPQKAMVDFIDSIKKYSVDTIKKEDFITRSPHLKIDFLPAVLRPQQSPNFDYDRVKDVFGLLDKGYDYVVIDAGKSFSDGSASVLNQANLILLIVNPDVLCVYQAKWALEILQLLQFPLNMVKIILNRAESASSISWQEVKVNLPVDMIAQIPSEGKVVGLALNRGVPVVVDSPKSKVSLSIKKLSQVLAVDNKLFIEHRNIERPQIKGLILENYGEFWKSQGLAEPLKEAGVVDEKDEMLLLKRRIHSRLIEELNLKKMDLKVFSDINKTKELRGKAEATIANLLTVEGGSFITSSEDRRNIIKEIVDEALGLGPLEDLLNEPTITDIMVNNKDEIYVERYGKMEFTNKKFISNEQVKIVIERIIAPIGRRIDESAPMVDARLPDGSRVNAIIPPLALTGPCLTIRKFRKERFKIDELIKFNTLDQAMADFLMASVLVRKNMIVSGGTGSGKTTVLNVLSTFIQESERIVTIEDAAELKLHQEHWIRLESRPPNIEGKGSITIRDIFRNTLRMRPDRIIIGECRGLESLDMLQAMNTGHDGSMTTIHANSTQDVLTRIDSMILMSGVELPIRAIREMIGSAVDIIVHTARLSDGSRKITQITEITGMKDEVHIDVRDIFVFKQTGIDANGKVLGGFHATGYIPSFIEDIKIKGIPLSDNTFKVS
jgi:pilus assembly protein CpaF